MVSSLASYTNFRSDRNTPRTKKIDTIIVDEAKSNYSIEKLGSLGWCPNYGIDSNGKIGAYVKESIITDLLQRPQYDDRAVSIYLASEDNYPYKITDKAYDSLVKLIADICKRNGIKKFVWDSNKDNRVNLRNGANCVHAIDFAYRTYGMNGELFGKMGSIANRVNEILNSNK
ncbi:MAG: N-acetylmuramoyl-L-alanine amidase [Ruminococcus sp.]|nr:N-acetylmuramoyl-L-alanine amidase [Ruminococcus sp.]